MSVSIWAGDTLPQLVFRLVTADGSGAQDLTGCAATITIAPIGTTGAPILTDGGHVFDPAGGGISYTLPRPLTLPIGVAQALYQGQWTLNFGSGKVLHSSVFTITVLRPLDG